MEISNGLLDVNEARSNGATLTEFNPLQSSDRILQSVKKLTIERGWNKVRLSAVAQDAGVSRPLVYKIFGDKQRLGWALIEKTAGCYTQTMRKVLKAATGPPRETVGLLVMGVCIQAQNDPLVAPLLESGKRGGTSLISAMTTHDAPIRKLVFESLYEWVSQQYPEAPDAEVRRVIDHITRCVLSFILSPPEDLEASAKTLGGLVDCWLGGGAIRAQEETA